MTSWNRLIRFTPDSDPNVILYGDPIGSDLSDIGALAEKSELEAKVVEVGNDGPLSDGTKVTERVEKVGKLLSPLAIRDCPGIKCIGLNYKKHSTSMLFGG